MRQRTKGRNYALKLMYACDMTGNEPAALKADFRLEYTDENDETIEFGETLFDRAYSSKEADESLIKQFLTSKWPYERMGTVDKSILHLAVSELFGGDAPTYAILDDYVTMAKEYGDDKSASFINAILEKIREKFSIERGNDGK